MRSALAVTVALAAWAGVSAEPQIQTKVFRDKDCKMQINGLASESDVCEQSGPGSSQRLTCQANGDVLIKTYEGEGCRGSPTEKHTIPANSCQKGTDTTYVSLSCSATAAAGAEPTATRAKEQYWALRHGALRKTPSVQQPLQSLEGGGDEETNPLDAEEGEGIEVKPGKSDEVIDGASLHGTGIHGEKLAPEPEIDMGPEPEPEPLEEAGATGTADQPKEEQEEATEEEEPATPEEEEEMFEEEEEAAAEYAPDTPVKKAGPEPHFTMRLYSSSRCDEEVDRRSKKAGACFKLGGESQRFVPERDDAVTLERFPGGSCTGFNSTYITLPLGRCAALLGTPLFVVASVDGSA